jgi:hypothetical protein
MVDEMYCIPFSKPVDVETDDAPEEGRDPSSDNKKDLDVTFVFPKCKFLVEARKVYQDKVAGDRVWYVLLIFALSVDILPS